MYLRNLALVLVVTCLLFATPSTTTAQRSPGPARPSTERAHIPSPREVLGFTPGDDRKLASWNQVLTYFDKLDQASERVKFQALGKTTMDVPFVMATISSPKNLERLEEYRQIQDSLADPRKLGPARVRDQRAAQLFARGKTIVLITCGIHSTEVGSYLSSMLIAHRLATSDEPEIQNILNNTIVLLVPSLNPDGVDIVKNWYDKTLGTPYEGTSPPELYHKYVGHDNNRDWYAFTQVETKITVSKIHNVWHPQIVHDIHQQNAFGSRLFLPPYMPPVEPNVPKQLVAGYTELGNWMAGELRAKGFEGITTNTTYDAWTPARAYSHYHGGVRILSETASARIATPITVKFEELRSREGYDPQKASDKFGPVWRGGPWGLRDITNYMTTAAFTLLTHAADNREQWLRRFYEVGREAVRPRQKGELIGFKFHGTNEGVLLDILNQAEVEYRSVPGTARNRESNVAPRLHFFVALAQPYGNFAKALLERQNYPNLRDADNHPISPYDVTAHSFSLLAGLEVEPVYSPIRTTIPHLTQLIISGSTIENKPKAARLGLYKSHMPSMDEGWTRWILEQQKNPYRSLHDAEIRSSRIRDSFDTILIPDQIPRALLNGYAAGSMPPEYTGGLGQEGVKALRAFVEDGGTLIFLNRASEFAIEQFKLPLRNAVAGVPRTEFYVPGSILRIELDRSHPIAEWMPKYSIAWVEESPVFEIVNKSSGGVDPADVKIVGWYPREKDPLLSGWLLGGDRIKGKAALVEVKVGQGRMILFGFRPQYRAQSLATYPLLFNALGGK